MKLLLHTCCGPCLLYPLSVVEVEHSFDVTTYFYNPNIHPYREYKKRRDTFVEYCRSHKIKHILEKDYDPRLYFQQVSFNETERCSFCYDLRLERVAEFAVREGYDFFSTTLLYSRYQNHSLIREKCSLLAEKYDISFFYHDFREGWQKGIDLSVEQGMYRQPYCGCLYSEQERYDNRLKKKLRKQRRTQ